MEKQQSELKKNLVVNRYTVWTVPNILVFFRILCVPVYMTLIILSSKPQYPDWWIYIALGLMALAASTDVFDGMIARKFTKGTKIGKHVVRHDQGTYVGQLIDPIADKTMHIGALIALSAGGFLHWAFIIVIAFRELVMIVAGSTLMNKINVKSNMLGKVASAILSIGIIMTFFHTLICENLWATFSLDWIVVTIGCVLNWAAGVGYLLYAIKEKKKLAAASVTDVEGQPQQVPESSEKADVSEVEVIE